MSRISRLFARCSAEDRPVDAQRVLKIGQWAKYRVTVPSTGYYGFTCQAASAASGRFHLEFNGVNVTGPVQVHPAGGPKAWVELHRPRIRLTAGEQYMKIVCEAGSLDLKSVQASKSVK